MSYLALARKWRPTTFAQVVGQDHVLTALENALNQNRLHHAYLFSGTRGVGKTSIGRLFAKGLNCETGVTSTPCGQCHACIEIDQGRFVDLLEIDAASRTKVEDTREILDNVQYKPAYGRYKVYLIDEVHMLSKSSFNALLKTLEEPPEYVKFLLATTDPQKLPMTVLSRCLQFHLKPITVEKISQQLEHILACEKFEFEARALSMIAHAADGSMRDALSLTDQAIALGNGVIVSQTVAHMLGTIDSDHALHLLQAISSKLPQQAMDCIELLAQNGVDWDSLLQQLATQLHRIAMYQALPDTLDNSLSDAEKIVLLSRLLSPQDVQLYYQIVLKGRQDIPLSPSQRIGLEMIVLRMMAFRPFEAEPLNPLRIELPTLSLTRSMDKGATTAILDTAVQPTTTLEHQVTPVPAHEECTNHPSIDTKVEVTVAAQSEPSLTALGRVRHQLRSKRNELKEEAMAEAKSATSHLLSNNQVKTSADGAKQESGIQPKKSNAASPSTSVIERVLNHANPDFSRYSHQESLPPLSPHLSTSEKNDQVEAFAQPSEEPYQWRATQELGSEREIKQDELTPSQIKQALAHVKTPEMAEKLHQQSLMEDPWYALIQKLNLPKLVEQVALNSTYHQAGELIQLTLRPQFSHLNNERARQTLSIALSKELAQNHQVVIEISNDGVTPLERKENLYQQKLQHAFVSLEQDPHVQFIQTHFAATLDKDSVRPL